MCMCYMKAQARFQTDSSLCTMPNMRGMAPARFLPPTLGLQTKTVLVDAIHCNAQAKLMMMMMMMCGVTHLCRVGNVYSGIIEGHI